MAAPLRAKLRWRSRRRQKHVAPLLQASPPGQAGRRGDWTSFSGPERAEQALEASKRQQEYLAQVVSGMKTFYAAVTPERQKTFDSFHGGAPKQ